MPGPLLMGEAEEQKEMTQCRNRVRNTVRHPRQPMALHQNVLLQDRDTKLWCIKGKVMAIRPNGRYYIVKTEPSTYLRGMQFIKADLTESLESVLAVVSATCRGAGPVSCMKAVHPRRPRRKVTFDRTVEFVP